MTKERRKGRVSQGRIDRFRVAAAFLVVAIHTYPLASVSGTADFIAVHVWARVAVPFFFCVTGYFLVSGFWGKQRSRKKWLAFLKKTAGLYALSILLYLPVNLYAGHFRNMKGAWDAAKAVLFDGTMYHLWYLPAALLGVSLIWLLSGRMGRAGVMGLSLVLYGGGLPGDSYYGLISRIEPVRSLYDRLFAVSSYTRNGLFYAPVFLMLGVLAAERKRRLPRTGAALGLVFSLAVMTGEGLLLHKNGFQRHDSMYLFLVPAVFFLFDLLLKERPGTAGKREERFCRMLRTFSMTVYVIHPMMILAVRIGARVLRLTSLLVENSVIHYLAVSLFSAAFAFLAAVLTELHREGKDPKGRAWMEVDRDAVRHNVRMLQSLLPEGCELMPAVKADGYGIGAVSTARLLRREGVRAFCVATVKEGIQLRRKGIRGEILVLGYTAPEQFLLLKCFGLTQTVVDKAYAEEMEKSGLRLKAHVKIDTGMHRLGEEAGHQEEILKIFQMRHLRITGMFTHLCVCDERTEESRSFTEGQARKFLSVVRFLEMNGITGLKLHMLSSYGIWNYPGTAGDYVRPGIGLLGVKSSPGDETEKDPKLRPAVAVKARVALIRKLDEGEAAGYGLAFRAGRAARLAVVTIGYADGIPRSLSNGRGGALIRGRRAPIVGRICMDQLLLDVTDIPGAAPGDTAVLIGISGESRITAEETAYSAGTITNELFSRIGKRLERVYI